MLSRLIKRVLVGLSAVALAATTGTAFAGGTAFNNLGATIDGVSGHDANGPGCPTGNFCLYTEPFGDGMEFALYRCGVYTLRNWHHVGSFTNNNTGGARAQLLDRNRRVIRSSAPFQAVTHQDFRNVWYVRAC